MPIQRLVVVADAHLGPRTGPLEDALLRWLDEVPALGDALLLNGDLFGFWFTYRRAIPRAGIRVVARLAALARELPVLLVGGNHDRWGDSFWEREFGIRYSPRELRFELGTSKVLAIHGDGLPDPSWRTALKQRVVSHPLASLGYRLLPAELGFRLAERFAGPGAPSPRLTRLTNERATLQRVWAAERLRQEPELGLLIMGHTHRAVAEEVAPGRRYLNPGAWCSGYCYALATDRGVELRQYPG